MAQRLTVSEILSGKLKTLQLDDTTLNIKQIGTKSEVNVTYRQVISASFNHDNGILEVAYLYRKKKGVPLTLIRIEGRVQDPKDDAAAQWAETLMHNAYEGSGVKRGRQLQVLVNPHGGIGKGVAVFIKTVEPILRAAKCSMDVIYTTHSGHAYDIAKGLSLKYDAVVTVSGDGLVHEVMNGFAHHPNPVEAFTIPIAPIPTGSGNGLAINLLGIQHGFDVTEASLNVLKGRPMKVDVFSLTQNGKRTISFMSQALGLMAELDIGTEHLRWMGDTRFFVGMVRGIVQFKSCPVQLSYKVAEDNKLKMVEALQARRLKDQQEDPPPALIPPHNDGGLPLSDTLSDETWTTFKEPILYIYAGKGPYVGRDFMAFPVSLPDDGLIDLTAVSVSSRKDFLSILGGAAKGENYWSPKLHYVKAHAYRVKPLAKAGSLAVDGEELPFEEFQVEVHQKLATLLSPHGHYAVHFPSGANETKGNNY